MTLFIKYIIAGWGLGRRYVRTGRQGMQTTAGARTGSSGFTGTLPPSPKGPVSHKSGFAARQTMSHGWNVKIRSVGVALKLD